MNMRKEFFTFMFFIFFVTTSAFDQLYEETIFTDDDQTKETRDWKTQCRLPDFTAALPLHFRREMKKIWGGLIVLGRGKCERQKQQTMKLVEEFPEDLKQKIIKWEEEQSDPVNRISFIHGLPMEHIRKFTEIMTATQSVSQRSQRLREWGKDLLDSTSLTQLEQYILFLERRAERFREKIKRLTPDTRIAFERLQSLKRERQRLIDGFSELVKKELSILYRTKCPRYGAGDGADLDIYEMQMACKSLPGDKTKRITTSKPTSTTTTTTTTTTMETPVTSNVEKITKFEEIYFSSTRRPYQNLEIEDEATTETTTRRIYPKGFGGVPQLDRKSSSDPESDTFLVENEEHNLQTDSDQNMNGYVDSVAMILQRLFPRNNLYN